MTLELYPIRNVFTLRKSHNEDVWIRIGRAVSNADGTVRLQLDVVPLDGKMVIADAPPDVRVQSEAVHAS